MSTQNQAYNLAKLLNSGIQKVEELQTKYTGRKSFYHKARVITLNNQTKLLQSYETIVAAVLPNGKFVSNGGYSATTRNHEYEFESQFSRENTSIEDATLGKPFSYEGQNWQEAADLAATNYVTNW